MTRPTLVFVHGMWEAPWIFQNFLPYFHQRNYTTRNIRLPGHGNLISVKGLRIEDYVDHVVSQVKSIEGDVVLVGHSLGGLISVGAALDPRISGAIEKIVLLNSAPLGVCLMSRETRRRIWRYLPAIVSGISFTLNYRDALALELNCVENPREVYAMMTAESGTVARQLALWRYRPDTTQLRCPTFVIGAHDDKITPVRIQKKNAKLLPRSQRKTYQGGHMLPIEQNWGRVATDIEKFLQ